MTGRSWTRREIVAATAALALHPAISTSEPGHMLKRIIPGSNESLPVIGLGTYDVFDIAGSAEEMATRREIVDLLIESSGSLIDSSPMYNLAEKTVGDIVEAGDKRDPRVSTDRLQKRAARP